MVVYTTYESRILKSLADFFPEHAERLLSIEDRLWDQAVIFKNHYKHSSFGGSDSLKSVLPVLVPSLSYDALDVQDGEKHKPSGL